MLGIMAQSASSKEPVTLNLLFIDCIRLNNGVVTQTGLFTVTALYTMLNRMNLVMSQRSKMLKMTRRGTFKIR
jgi:hypothetical protein